MDADRWVKQAQQYASCEFYEAVLPIEPIKVHRIDDGKAGYQRPLEASRVANIVEHFDASEARTIFVSLRADGEMFCLDGQHTREALLAVGIKEWICRVFVNLTPAQEAFKFQEYQRNSRRPTTVVQWNAEVLAKVPHKVAIEKVLTRHSLRISGGNMRIKEGFVPLTASNVFERVYALGGEELLDAVISVCIEAWGLNRNSFTGRAVMGVASYLAYANREVDRKRLVATLSNITTKTIVERCGSTGSGGAGRKASLVIQDVYAREVGGTSYQSLSKTAKTLPRVPSHVGRRKDGYNPKEPPYFE